MKQIITALASLLIFSCQTIKKQVEQPTESLIYDNIIFYNGYGETVNDPVPKDVIRLKNDAYVKKLSQEDLLKISDKAKLQVTIHARCDNYDRIGSVGLCFVTKGKRYSDSTIVTEQEIARFITPFMDKNKQPNNVDYFYEINNIAKLLNNQKLREKYDFWITFQLFGVPGAAQKQVKGCKDREDVFGGTVKFISSNKKYSNKNQKLVSLFSKQKLNNYQTSDVEGETIKTKEIKINKTLKNVKMYVITSNHGANEGGEEYIRREHFIYFDNKEIAKYIPGGVSCEPYRKHNTQKNGIYSSKPRTDEDWAKWNNWCPGSKIPTRVYQLGNLKKGVHKFKINVPDAVFTGKQGYIPLTVYIQGEE